MSDQHNMEMIETYPDHTEAWQCPICLRQLLVTWKPFAAIVVVEGDTTVAHAGAKGGISVGAVEVVDQRLDVFDEFMSERYGDG